MSYYKPKLLIGYNKKDNDNSNRRTTNVSHDVIGRAIRTNVIFAMIFNNIYF